jgi:hypothetical protein
MKKRISDLRSFQSRSPTCGTQVSENLAHSKRKEYNVSMQSFSDHIAQNYTLTDDEQKKAGQAMAGDMSTKHKEFVALLSKLIKEGTIDPMHPSTLLHQKIYDALDDALRTKVDLMLPNVAILLRHIADFYHSKETPDSCPQLAQMIDQLWEMKERIEQEKDVFVF